MSRFESLKAITRRALRIEYRSPLVCELPSIVSASGTGEVSTLDILPTFRLPGPTLSLTKLSESEIRLDWNEVPNAYAYVVYRATNPEGPFLIVVSGLIVNFFVDAIVDPGTYFYRVTGIEPDFGETEASNIVSETI